MVAPQPSVIRRSDPARLDIEWSDGATSKWTAAELRRRCPCALCVDEHTGIRILDPETVADDVTQAELALVGNYAVSMRFSDGHHTGIFTWEMLRGTTGSR